MTGATLIDRTLKRLDQDPAQPVYFTRAEVLDALNEGQRIFAFLTLCLEGMATFPLTAGVAFYSMLATYADWLLPLRVVRASDGEKVMPASLVELDALDDAWTSATSPASHYGCLGFDLFFVRGTQGSVTITYARMPAAIADSAVSSAEIPDAYQPALIDYAISRVRLKQGGQEFSKTLPNLKRFLDAVAACAKDVMARFARADNDRKPFELSGFNLKALMTVKLPKQQEAQP